MFRRAVKYALSTTADILARWQRFHFPAGYPWYWKFEYLLRRYERETTLFFKRHIKPGMVVIDVGANLGYFTRLFSRLVGDAGIVYAFEPDEENWPYLIENTKHLRNVRPFKTAVSDAVGTVDFYHVIGATGTHSIVPAEHAERRTVQTTTLDDFLRTQGISKAHVIKVDVEGAEDKVFAGMKDTFASHPIIVFEYTPGISESLAEVLQKEHTLYALSTGGGLQSFSNISYRTGKRRYANVVLSDDII